MTNVTTGTLLSINISTARGQKKKPVPQAAIIEGKGIEGDAHFGCDPIKQISLLAYESHLYMHAKGLITTPGDFAENLTTEGISVHTLPVGTRITIGTLEFEVTQIGKECHSHCEIYRQTGECVMPREGIFVRALASGIITTGDQIAVKTV